METAPLLEKEKVYTVKIYFISPISLISTVIDALTRLEFEAYTVDKRHMDKLLKILSGNIRNVIYICIINESEAAEWIEYIERLQKVENTFIQIGAFAHSKIPRKTIDLFLSRSVPVISFYEISENTLEVMKKILLYFEAKGKRKHIRARSMGGTDAFFTIESLNEPLKATITDISVEAFSCEVDPAFKSFFEKDMVHHKILLVLRGIRVRVSAKVIGFAGENPNLYILKFVNPKIENGQMIIKDELLKGEQDKIFGYIRNYLKESVETELEKISDE